jgi:ketosteroid isomerase-like protein
MKKTISKGILLAILWLSIGFTSAKAQSATAKQFHYQDYVGENPDADADISLVSDYLKKLVGGDVDKATSMLATGFTGYGPGPGDSSNVHQVTEGWKHGDSVQLNRKNDFVAATFNVKSGDLAGHWVEVWGTYSFTENGKDVKFPYQYSAHVKNGKIDRDNIYYDQLYIVKALGFTVTPPAK